MVTDSVAPRPSAKMLGHIQHPSIPAVCVCVCWCVRTCSCVCVKCSGPPGEREPLTAKKMSHHTSLVCHTRTHTRTPARVHTHTHTHTHCSRTRMVTGCVFRGFWECGGKIRRMYVCLCACVDIFIHEFLAFPAV